MRARQSAIATAVLTAALSLAACELFPTTDPPPDRPRPDAGADGGLFAFGDAGTPAEVDDSVLRQGITRDRLRFVAVGDTRPETSGGAYPTDVALRLFASMNQRDVDFGVFLGDYVYVFPDDYARAKAQMSMFKTARRNFGKPIAYVLGNHEAFGGNLVAYQELFSSQLFYRFSVQTGRGEAKFVVVADNHWGAQQETWLRQELSRTTATTFVLRHYAMNETSGQRPLIAAVIREYPVSIVLSGHNHKYEHAVGSREVIIGTGGAPLVTGARFGYLTVEQREDGKLALTRWDLTAGAPVDSDLLTPY